MPSKPSVAAHVIAPDWAARSRLRNSLSYKSHRSDLNRRPLDYESRALPLSYGGAVPNLATCCSARYSTASAP